MARRHWPKTAAIGALALPLLAGCYEISSNVPAVTEASRLAEQPLLPGHYCGVDVSLDEAGAIGELTLQDCVAVSVSDGAFVLSSEDPAETETMSFEAAELTRGARLLQSGGPDAGYALVIAMMREDAVAVLDEPILTQKVEAAAAAAGVALRPAEETGDEISIVEGEPEAVLGFMREAAGFMFDDALRDEALHRNIKEDALYYVRVGTTSADADLDMAAVREKVDVLATMIERAMSLE